MPPVEKPNYTQIPNSVLDGLAQMKEAEARVVMALCRRTFGWHKRSDRVSLTQLQELTGMSRQGVIQGIEAALEHKWIKRVQHGQAFTYTVLVNEVDQSTKLTSQPSRPELVNEVDQSAQKLVNEVDTQKKELPKEKERKTVAAATARPNEFAIYETEIGVLTPAIADQLKADIAEYPAGWLEDAIRTAALANVRKYSYVRAILSRWHKEGRGRQQTPASNGRKPPDDPTFDGFVVPIIPLEDTP